MLLPFARGLIGVITDNTCKATLEMEDALNSNKEDSIIKEMDFLSQDLMKLQSQFKQENSEVRQR